MVDALDGWKGGPVCWTHIGGGDGEERARACCGEAGRKENVIYDITGFMDGAKVQKIYETRGFDVFVNTSRKEGVPVSIMEAMRFGTRDRARRRRYSRNGDGGRRIPLRAGPRGGRRARGA